MTLVRVLAHVQVPLRVFAVLLVLVCWCCAESGGDDGTDNGDDFF